MCLNVYFWQPDCWLFISLKIKKKHSKEDYLEQNISLYFPMFTYHLLDNYAQKNISSQIVLHSVSSEKLIYNLKINIRFLWKKLIAFCITKIWYSKNLHLKYIIYKSVVRTCFKTSEYRVNFNTSVLFKHNFFYKIEAFPRGAILFRKGNKEIPSGCCNHSLLM